MKTARIAFAALSFTFLTGIEFCESSSSPTPDPSPPGGADTFSIGEAGAQPTVYAETASTTAPHAFDPYIDTYFQSAGPSGPGTLVTLERSYAGSPLTPAETVRLLLPAAEIGTFSIANGSLVATHATTTRKLASDSGTLTSGTVTVTRADTRLVGEYSVSLCTEAQLAAAACPSPVTLAGQFDITRRVAGGAGGGGPPDEAKPDLEVVIKQVDRDPVNDRADFVFVITNRGAGASIAGTYNLQMTANGDDDDACDEDQGGVVEMIHTLASLQPGESTPEIRKQLSVTSRGGNACVGLRYPHPEATNALNEGWRMWGHEEADLSIAIDRVRHGHGVFVIDYVITNDSNAVIDFPLRASGAVTVQVFPNRATAPAAATPDGEATHSERLRLVLPPHGRYEGRSEFFAPSFGAAGTAYLRVKYEKDKNDANDVSAGVAWTGSWAGTFSDVGTQETPANLGSLSVATFGTVKRQSVYQVSVPPGEPVRIKLSGMNDPFGIDSWVPRVDVYQDAGFTRMLAICNRGGPDGPVEEMCDIDVPEGVGTLYLLVRVNGTSAVEADEGSSFFLEVMPGRGADFVVTIDEVQYEVEESGDDRIDIDFTVENRGTQAVYADAMPVFFFFGRDATDTPIATGTRAADGMSFVTVPGGFFSPGTSLNGTQRLDADDFDEPFGFVWAVVNGIVERTDACDSCVSFMFPESNTMNNVSMSGFWTEHERDFQAQLAEVRLLGDPAGRPLLAWRVRITSSSAVPYEGDLLISFRALDGEMFEYLRVLHEVDPAGGVSSDRPHDVWFQAPCVGLPRDGDGGHRSRSRPRLGSVSRRARKRHGASSLDEARPQIRDETQAVNATWGRAVR